MGGNERQESASGFVWLLLWSCSRRHSAKRTRGKDLSFRGEEEKGLPCFLGGAVREKQRRVFDWHEPIMRSLESNSIHNLVDPAYNSAQYDRGGWQMNDSFSERQLTLMSRSRVEGR